MRSAEIALEILMTLAFVLSASSGLAGCGKSSLSGAGPSGGCPAAGSSCASSTGPTPIPTGSSGSLPLYVADPGTTGHWGYPDEPLVSVTLCSPKHTAESQCQVISNVLLDTGSYGLRIFASAIAGNVQLTQQTITAAGKTLDLAECALFGTGSDWGPVKNADVVIGGQTAGNIPIQVIDVGYASIPSECADLCPDTDPCTSGFNGVLGVGVFAQDCGSGCDSSDETDNPGIYFGCDDSGCYDGYHGGCGSGACGLQVSLAEQVVNPVALLPSGFNNGVAVSLPSVPASGASGITGSVALGIGSPSSATAYPADPDGITDGKGMDFVTSFQGAQFGYGSPDGSGAFIDSGSNGIFFPSGISTCQGGGFYCPSSEQSLSATIAGYSGSPSYNASFSIGNAQNLVGSDMSAFSNIGGPMGRMFDWGLPFFFGRTVYVGIAGTTATVGGASATGPYWAF